LLKLFRLENFVENWTEVYLRFDFLVVKNKFLSIENSGINRPGVHLETLNFSILNIKMFSKIKLKNF